MGLLKAVLCPLWAVLSSIGDFFLCRLFGYFLTLLALLWAVLGSLWPSLCSLWEVLSSHGPSLGSLEPSGLGPLWAVLGSLGPSLCSLWLSWVFFVFSRVFFVVSSHLCPVLHPLGPCLGSFSLLALLNSYFPDIEWQGKV